jgi:hypothetical protein
MAFGQWTLFTVDDDALPGGTTYPTLAGALATAATYPNGPHKIMIMEGDYYDVNMTVANVNEIYGDPAEEPGDIVFHGASNFLTLISGVTISNMTITGYADALQGPGASNCTIQNVIFDDNNRAIVFWGVSDNNVVDACQFTNNATLAVYFDGLGNSVTDCTFDTNTGYGVYMGGGTGTVTGCTFANGGNFAVQLLGDGNVVNNCTFDTNAGYGLYFSGSNSIVEDCLFSANTGYGVTCAAGSGALGFNTIKDNCFIGNNGGVQGSDGTAVNWWSHNYWSDDAGTTYALAGGGGNFDYNPWRRENQVTGLTTVDVLDSYHVDLNWVSPPCAAGDPVQLAAYEFTVTFDPLYLEYVGADNAGLLGSPPEALYTMTTDLPNGKITFAGANFTTPSEVDGILAFIDFTAKATTASTVISVSSDYRDENNNLIPYGSQSLTLAVIDDDPPDGTVVPYDPIGNMTFSDTYSMKFSGAANDNYCLSQVWYRVVDVVPPTTTYIGWTLIKSLSGTADIYGEVTVSMATVPEGGPYTLEVLFRDCSSNDFSVLKTFNVDKTGPDVANLVLADLDGCGATPGYTNADEITVSWDNPDASAVQYEFYYSKNPGWAIYGPTTGSSPVTFTLDGTEVTDHRLYVRQYDVYGNMGPQIGWTEIALDKTPGSPSGLTLDGGAAKTADKTIAVSATAWSVASGSLYYFLTETKSEILCDADGWLPIDPPYVYNFDLVDEERLHWVFRATMDIAGNVSAVDSASITLDKTPAEFDAFAVADATGSECSDNWTVSVTFASDDPGIKKVHLRNTVPGPYTTVIDISAMTTPFTVQYPIVAGACDDDNIIYGILEDDIGNMSVTEFSNDIFVDCYAPTAGTVVLNGANFTWTANPVVSVDLTGVSADVNEILMSKVSLDYSAAVVEDFYATSPSTTFDFGTPPENIGVYLYVKVEDCADRQSVEATGGWVAFDLTNPVLSAVSINGGAASTNNPLVSVGFTCTELHKQTVYISKNADMSAAVSFPWAGGPPYPFTLTGPDGRKDVYVQVEDFVGRKSAIVTDPDGIDYDGTVPVAGTFTITSGNLAAIGGWTSSLPGNTWAFTPADPDIVWMHIENLTGTGDIVVSPFTLPAGGTLNTMVDPVAPYPDLAKIRYRLRDDANNQTGWFYAEINYDPINPPPPSNAVGVPGGSVAMSWDAVPNAHYYQIRYNFTNEHPVYGSGYPPFPTTMGQGILEVDELEACTYDFEGPQDDLYALTVWTLSKAGLWSLAAANVLENNYRLGDFESGVPPVLGSDGCLTFETEFFDLANAYGTSLGGPGYNQYLDFAPTFDYGNLSPADPDGNVDFEDLVVFALNYKWSRTQDECEGAMAKSTGGAIALTELTVSAEIPSYVRSGEEFSVPISISDGAGVAGYHLVFNYDREALELVSVNPGQVYEGVAKTFFYHDSDAAGIDISSAVLNDDGLKAGEIAVATFRTRTSGSVTLEDALLDIRNWNNQKANVSFSVTAKTGSLPTAYAVSQNYPNPFNPTTAIELAMPQAGQYRLTIYNVIGQVVEVFEGYADAGYMTFNWDASKQASGVYLYKVTAGEFSATRKMILLK